MQIFSHPSFVRWFKTVCILIWLVEPTPLLAQSILSANAAVAGPLALELRQASDENANSAGLRDAERERAAQHKIRLDQSFDGASADKVSAANSGTLQLISRETFQGVGTLNSTTPGSLGVVSNGNFFKRPVGPRLTADTTASLRGWSADFQRQGNAYFAPFTAGSGVLPASAVTDRAMFAVDFWLYLDEPITDGSNGKHLLFLGKPDSDSLVELYLAADGTTLLVNTYGTQAGPGYTMPLRTWVNVRVAFAQIEGYWNYQSSILVRAAGESEFSEVYTTCYQPTLPLSVLEIGLGNRFNGNGAPARARMGMFSAYKLGDWADRIRLDPTVVDPPDGPFDWYCNPATGNDGNDGCTPATAWASASKVNTESANTGMFGRAGFGNGDSLTIDTTTANLVLGRDSLTLKTQGSTYTEVGGGRTGTKEIQAWGVLSNSGWTLVSGTTHVYFKALPIATPRSVVWEDDKWMNFALGANLAAIQSRLEATPGCCGTDGANAYVHPFEDTNPNTDGKNYTYSINRLSADGEEGAPAIAMAAPDLHLLGFRVRKTCLFDSVANTPSLSYCYDTTEAAGGSTQLENCYGAYAGAHVIGFTDAALDRHYTIINCQAEQCCPPSTYGQTSVWVDFTGSSGTGSATSLYENCVTRKNSGLIGSADGVVNVSQPIWLSHSAGGVAFASIGFVGCNLQGGPLFTYGDTAILQLIGGTIPSGIFAGGSVTYGGTKIVGRLPSSLDGTASITGRSCLIVLPGLDSAANETQGIADWQGCTIDASAANVQALYHRTGTFTLTWRNNFLVGAACPVIDAATSADTITFDHNAYSPGSGSVISNYNDGVATFDLTLAQWQALGKDAVSFDATDPQIDVNLRPLAGSPLIDAGADLGSVTDFTGTLFPHRNDIGAYEYVPVLAITSANTATATVGMWFSYQIIASGNPMSFTVSGLPAGLSINPTTGVLSGMPTTPGVYSNIQIKASNGLTPSVRQTFSLTVVNTQSNYAASYGLTGANAAPGADPDGDGLSNLAEYALNLNPAQSDAGSAATPQSQVAVRTYGTSKFLSILFTRVPLATDVTYIVESSPDLATWTTVATSSGGAVLSGAGVVSDDASSTAPHTVEVRDTVATTDVPDQRRFLRVRFTLTYPHP